MQKFLPRCFSALVCLLLMSGIAHGFAPVVHISAKPTWIGKSKVYSQKPPGRNIENGSYDALIEEQINVEKQAVYNHCITEIVSGSGVQNGSQISVSFNPAYQRLDFHDITVWRDNKPQNRLSTDVFKMLPDESEMDRFIYNGTYSAKYILPDIRKGDRIEYSYTVTGFNPIFDGKFCRTIYFQGTGLIAHQYTTLLFSPKRQLHIKCYNLLSQPKISTQNGLTFYEWEDFQVPALKAARRQPDWVNQYAHAQVSDFNNWKEVVDWGMRINPIQTNFSGALAAEIAKIKKASARDKEKYFRSAVKLVQEEVRYMGIETGEYSHRANHPDKVFNHRYGDCKDKSLLLASILNAGGIEAHLVLINTGLKSHLDNYLPANTLFDHACIVANVKGKQVWVDATISNQGGKGTNIYFPAYGKALVLKAGNMGLTDIPRLKTGKITAHETYVVNDQVKPVSLVVTTTYTDNQADDIRYTLASQSQDETEKNYLDYYLKAYPKIEASDSVKIIDDKDKNELTTVEHYRIKDFFKRDSTTGKYESHFYSNYIYEQLPTVAQEVTTPVNVNYPYAVDHTISVTLPLGWDIEDKQDSIKREAYTYNFDRTVDAKTLNLHYRFAYLKDHVEAADLGRLRQDVKDLQDEKLYFAFSYTPDLTADSGPSDLNPGAFLLTIVFVLAFVFFTTRMLQTDIIARRKAMYTQSMPLGGWIVVLIVTLFITIFYSLFTISKYGYLTVGTWDAYGKLPHGNWNQASLIFNLAGHLFFIMGSITCLVLIFNKRNKLPRIISVFFMVSIGFLVINVLTVIFLRHSDITAMYVTQVIISLAKSIAWILYFKRSERVKQTFVLPYPLKGLKGDTEQVVSFETLI